MQVSGSVENILLAITMDHFIAVMELIKDFSIANA